VFDICGQRFQGLNRGSMPGRKLVSTSSTNGPSAHHKAPTEAPYLLAHELDKLDATNCRLDATERRLNVTGRRLDVTGRRLNREGLGFGG